MKNEIEKDEIELSVDPSIQIRIIAQFNRRMQTILRQFVDDKKRGRIAIVDYNVGDELEGAAYEIFVSYKLDLRLYMRLGVALRRLLVAEIYRMLALKEISEEELILMRVEFGPGFAADVEKDISRDIISLRYKSRR